MRKIKDVMEQKRRLRFEYLKTKSELDAELVDIRAANKKAKADAAAEKAKRANYSKFTAKVYQQAEKDNAAWDKAQAKARAEAEQEAAAKAFRDNAKATMEARIKELKAALKGGKHPDQGGTNKEAREILAEIAAIQKNLRTNKAKMNGAGR